MRVREAELLGQRLGDTALVDVGEAHGSAVDLGRGGVRVIGARLEARQEWTAIRDGEAAERGEANDLGKCP
jgi:hypothetical protein